MRRSWPVARLISFTSSKNVNISRKSFSTVIVKQSSGMKDEYGTMDSSGNSFIFKNFQLESGKILQEAEVCCNDVFEQ